MKEKRLITSGSILTAQRRTNLSSAARNPGVRRFTRRMRPQAETRLKAGRWDGSAAEDVAGEVSEGAPQWHKDNFEIRSL